MSLFFFFFFNDTATTEIYTLSLHDALPISRGKCSRTTAGAEKRSTRDRRASVAGQPLTPSPARQEEPRGRWMPPEAGTPRRGGRACAPAPAAPGAQATERVQCTGG